MATRHVEEDKQNDVQVNAIRQSSDSEEEQFEDQNWDGWNEEDDGVEEQDLILQLLCLFCDSQLGSCSSLFEHCASAHFFDFYGIKKAYKLDFYKCFKLINYVRSQVAVNKCWSCGVICISKAVLQKHLHEAANFDGSSFPWDDDSYLNPFLQDDSLLYSFGEDDEDEEGDAISADTEELASYLSQFEQIDIHDEGASNVCGSELRIPCENGGKDVVLSSDNDVNIAKPLETAIANGTSNVVGGILSYRNRKNEMYSVSSSKIAENEIKSINKNYFGSYSSFGIHREMISDKVRTDSYKQAILENPSLLRNAIVMDVGCGTGILSLFAAQAGASRVVAVEASEKMAAVATQIAKDNSLLRNGISHEGSKQIGVIEVVQGMVEELDNADHAQPHSVDVLLSEWMGYCLLYESMLISVLYARDKWLKPGGAILPDTATMFVAGFGRGATSIPFWENVYGFNMSCIGQEVVGDAARFPIIDVIDSCNIVTTSKVLQAFDLVTMQPKQMDFTSEVVLEPKLVASLNNPIGSEQEITWCYGVVLWFETGFTERFCHEKPVVLSTSPYDPRTHWSQTILTFREPIAMASTGGGGEKLAPVGTNDCPAARIQSRISIVRASQHRSIDISLELIGIGSDGRKRNWPVQMFNLN
ncbi:Protein arginine N-methyltransferase PRMT1 [Handroanthus impetiginosus]|uniref:Protein arginine N-methyltransferase PRMT1 n=1 Tax=Handroanthus impetiginosus TaxID=429701 RepID=A0A2G9GT04_9LAMI|nr:Protein arginine N-methyltransferase PRMT1 [Handroanthus impetiginosus]